MGEERSDAHFLSEAVALAVASVAAGGGPFGALVVRGDAVVGRGRNRVTLDRDPSAHAEIVALRDAGVRTGDCDLSGCVLYASCEPCPMCYAAALWARLDRVVYAATRLDAERAGFDDAHFHAELTRPPGERALRAEAGPSEAADTPFAAWLAKPDRVPY